MRRRSSVVSSGAFPREMRLATRQRRPEFPEAHAVAITNLQRSGRRVDIHYFVAGRKNGDSRPRPHADAMPPHLPRHCHFRITQPRSAGKGEFLADAPEPRFRRAIIFSAQLGRAVECHALARDAHMLDHHHRIRASWHSRGPSKAIAAGMRHWPAPTALSNPLPAFDLSDALQHGARMRGVSRAYHAKPSRVDRSNGGG